jgi:hypothetical protein
MAYKHLHGHTTIRKERLNNLSVSLDYDSNPKRLYPVLLFTPSMSNLDNHHHIALSKKQARIFRDWLNEYLKDEKKGFKKHGRSKS